MSKNCYVLRWSCAGKTPRKMEIVGIETYGPERLADLLLAVEKLLAHGYVVSVTPPSQPITIATDCKAA
jgi:hypothetical protein